MNKEEIKQQDMREKSNEFKDGEFEVFFDNHEEDLISSFLELYKNEFKDFCKDEFKEYKE